MLVTLDIKNETQKSTLSNNNKDKYNTLRKLNNFFIKLNSQHYLLPYTAFYNL
jgi:hypothetical protein